MISLLSHFVQVAHAADVPNIAPVGNSGTSGDPTATINSLYTHVFDIFTLVIGLLAVLYALYGAYQYITSAGDAAKAKAARGVIINAMVGVIIAVAAYGIIRIGIGIGQELTGIAGTNTTDQNQNDGTTQTGDTPVTNSDGSVSVQVERYNAADNSKLSTGTIVNVAISDPKGVSSESEQLTLSKVGSYSVTATSSGYQTCSSTINFDGNGTLRVYLKKATDPSSVSCKITYNQANTSGDGTTTTTGGNATLQLFDKSANYQLDTISINVTLTLTTDPSQKGTISAHKHNESFSLTNNGPFNVNTDAPSGFNACNVVTDNSYSSTNSTLQLALVRSGSSGNCTAKFTQPTAANPTAITFVAKDAFDNTNNKNLSGATLKIYDLNGLNPTSITIDNTSSRKIEKQGTRKYEVSRTGYKTCVDQATFYTSGTFTIYLIKSAAVTPKAALGGIDPNAPRCKFTPPSLVNVSFYATERGTGNPISITGQSIVVKQQGATNSFYADPEDSNTMSLISGEAYDYTIEKSGYHTCTGTETFSSSNASLTVTLSPNEVADLPCD